ncbi:hypothetical protein LINPERHAP1_LOCUS38450 [Linum perenne]
MATQEAEIQQGIVEVEVEVPVISFQIEENQDRRRRAVQDSLCSRSDCVGRHRGVLLPLLRLQLLIVGEKEVRRRRRRGFLVI